MKRLKLLINAGLLGGMLSVISCSEDVIINEGIGGENFSPDNKELIEYNVIASIKQPEIISRANIQTGGKYVWNAGDAITLWNRNFGKGYDFTITSSYNDAESSSTADFNGKAYFENANKIVAVYPKMESAKFNDWGTISIPDLHSQTSANAELNPSTYMVATGEFLEGKISDLEFNPLTALINFRVSNVSDRELKLYELKLEADTEVFPTEIKIDENCKVTGYAGLSRILTLNLNEQGLAQSGTLEGYINTLPTAYGDTRLISSNTKFSLSVKVWNGVSEQNISVFKNATIEDLNSVLGFDASSTANQFKAGCQYNLNIELEYRTIVPQEGFIIDEFGDIHIYNTKGLYEWNKIAADYPQANITLEKATEEVVFEDGSAITDFNIEQQEIDLSGKGEWSPISTMYGIFEGNGFTIKNITIKEKGFIENNGGTIQNLSFDNATVTNQSKSTGIVATTSNGKILNCHVKNVELNNISGENSSYGILVGEFASNAALLEGCSVEDCTLTIAQNSKNNPNVGGLVGKNAKGTTIYCYGNNITINTGNNTGIARSVGGIAGQCTGFIKASHVNVNITVSAPANLGGLVGVVNGGSVYASYATGSITTTYNNGNEYRSTGGLIGKLAASKAIGCYSTVKITDNVTSNKNIGAFCGIDQNGTKKENYVIQGTYTTTTGATVVTVDQLATKARVMNMAVREFDAKIVYAFFKNEDTTTKDEQPLILKPFDGNIPGFGGPDFGDGGDI